MVVFDSFISLSLCLDGLARGLSIYLFPIPFIPLFTFLSTPMASLLSLQHPQFICCAKSFESDDKEKSRAYAPLTSKFNVKDQETFSFPRSRFFLGFPFAYYTSSQFVSPRWFPSRAFSSMASTADHYRINSGDKSSVAVVHNCEVGFNRVECLVWVLHESARSFSLAIQTLELARSGQELAKAWAGVDVHAWHKQIAYQVAVYALLKAAIEVELFLSHKRCSNQSPVHEILSPWINFLEENIENQLNRRRSKLVQWFRTVELPRIAGFFIPLFKKWSMEYAGSGVAGIILAISCCASVGKLGSGRLSCPSFSASIKDILVELMDLSHNLVTVDKLYHLATEAGFEEDFLSHFGAKVLPCKNTDEIEFWIGLVQKKLSVAFHRESVISGKHTFHKVQENGLATLGLFGFLGRETRLFLSRMGIKDLDEHVKDFLSYLECGSLFICPEFAFLSEYQLFMEVVTDEIGWLDFYAAFRSKINQERRRLKQNANQAEKEIVIYSVFTICYDVFSGFAHYSNSTQQPLEGNLLEFLLRSQNLLSVCLEDYWAAYDKSGESLKLAEKDSSDSSPSLRSNGGATNSSIALKAQQKPIDLMAKGSLQHKQWRVTSSAEIDPVTLADTSSTELEPLHETLLKKTTNKLISASSVRKMVLGM